MQTRAGHFGDIGQRGISLVEVMLALTIGLILVAGITRLQVVTSKIYQVQGEHGRLQENARFIMDLLSGSIQDAGYMGCSSAATFRNNLNMDPLSNRYDYQYAAYAYVANPATDRNLPSIAAVEGYEWSAGSNISTLATDWTPNRDASIANPSPGNDILTIRGPLGNGTRLAANMASSTDDPSVPANSGLSVCDIVMVASCESATILQVTQITANAGNDDLAHVAGIPCVREAVAVPPGNTGALIGAASDLGTAYLAGDNVIPYGTTSYYIGLDAAGNSALYRQVNSNAAEQLIEGVERMQVTYGEDTDPVPAPPARPDLTPNHYVTADGVTDWRRVVSVRISLLLRTMEDNLADTPQTYSFDGARVTAEDRRLRYGFTLTIGLRNRLS